MALSELDRELIRECMDGDPKSWRTFCDRFAGLVMDVVDDSLSFAGIAGPQRSEELRERLTEDFFRELRTNRFAALRSFRGESSLATYLAVVARRSVLGQLSKLKPS